MLITVLSPSICWKTQHSHLPSFSTRISNHLTDHFLISIPESVTYTNFRMCHFYLISPLYTPLKGNITCDWLLLCLVYPPTFNIPSSEIRKTSSTLNPTQKMITTASVRQTTSLRLSQLNFLSLHYLSNTYNKYFNTLIVIPNTCLFINTIIIFDPLINLPNQWPLVWQALAVNNLPSLEYIVSTIPSSHTP